MYVEWSTKPDFPDNDFTDYSSASDGNEMYLYGLEAGKTYYIRAYICLLYTSRRKRSSGGGFGPTTRGRRRNRKSMFLALISSMCPPWGLRDLQKYFHKTSRFRKNCGRL